MSNKLVSLHHAWKYWKVPIINLPTDQLDLFRMSKIQKYFINYHIEPKYVSIPQILNVFAIISEIYFYILHDCVTQQPD